MASSATRPRRCRADYLLLVNRFLRGFVDRHRELVGEVERELA
jgi:hypothetical protein